MHLSVRHSLALMGLVFAGVSALAQQAPISAVTLYPGGATVQRLARVEAGATQLVISGMTTKFALSTLRIEADAGIHLGPFVTQDANQIASFNSAQAQREVTIQKLKDEIGELNVKSDAADIVRGYLERAGSSPAGDQTGTPNDGKVLTGLIAAIHQAATDAYTRKHQVAVQRRQIEQQIAVLERDLVRARSQSRESRTLTVQLTAKQGGYLRISYEVSSAGWRPAYRAELNSSDSLVNLDRLGEISQKTGEDWSNVKMVLSTNQPSISPLAIAPRSWLLDYVAPPPPQPQRAPEYARSAAAPVARAAPAPAPAAAPAAARAFAQEEAYQPPSFRVDGALATSFAVAKPVNLPSDGRAIVIPLGSESLPARQVVQVTPRLSDVAVLTAEVAPPPGVWPEGDLQLYRDGNYVGSTRWTPTGAPKWKLSFGRDDLIQVQFTSLKGDAASTGVFEKRNLRQIADQFTLRNNRDRPVDVLAIEASPVSVSEDIKVNATFNPLPTDAEWEKRRGVVAWAHTLASKASATFEMHYSIEFPKEGRVTGLR